MPPSGGNGLEQCRVHDLVVVVMPAIKAETMNAQRFQRHLVSSGQVVELPRGCAIVPSHMAKFTTLGTVESGPFPENALDSLDLNEHGQYCVVIRVEDSAEVIPTHGCTSRTMGLRCCHVFFLEDVATILEQTHTRPMKKVTLLFKLAITEIDMGIFVLTGGIEEYDLTKL